MSAIGEELRRLTTFEERHRRLMARLVLVVIATAIIDLAAAITIYFLERSARTTDIHTLGQAFFFTTVQLLTVSSQIQNPVTPVGRAVDVLLEVWAVIVVAGSAGAVASFFHTSDSG